MKPTTKLKQIWQAQRLQRKMTQAAQMMQPYMHRIDDESVLRAMLIVASVAACVAGGAGEPSALDVACREAARVSNIPAEVLRSYGDAMLIAHGYSVADSAH